MPSKPSSLPAKKRKTRDTSSHIESLEESLKTSVKNQTTLNLLLDLILLAANCSEPEDTHKALYALYRVFVLLVDLGRFCGAPGDAEEAKVVKTWLNERFFEYMALLCKCLQHDQKAIRHAALEILFSLLKHISEAFTKATTQPQLHISCFRRLLKGLLLTEDNDTFMAKDVLDHFIQSYLNAYDDIRWFFLRETALLLNEHKFLNKILPENVFSVLECLNTMPTDQSQLTKFWVSSFSKSPPGFSAPNLEEDGDDDMEVHDDWRTFFDTEEPDAAKSQAQTSHQRVYRLSTHQSLHSLPSHRVQFTQCWMALLPYLSSSSTLSIRALQFLHQGVLPHINKPIRLMDWITSCVDFGGSVGLLALNGLFTLIQHHNLDYPNFYTRLYAFLDRDLLHLKHRARFFRLTELFLSSTHLPATLLASFIKRLSRLSLHAPPAAIITIIPFTYNILKQHPACMVMIHRDVNSERGDPFIADEPSPYLTNALSSSLWELMSHGNHYHAPVATLARIFTDAFTKPSYDMEDFLDHTYTTLFEAEAKRKIKKEPPLALEHNRKLFTNTTGEDEEDTLIHSDVVTELWAF